LKSIILFVLAKKLYPIIVPKK